MNRKIFIVFLVSLASSVIFSQEISFKKLDNANILSSGTIYRILQDRTGFLWFGTDYGLYRFDGSELQIYRNDPDKPYSISDNAIWSLYEDRQGYIWVGTANGGLNRFDPATEQFIHWMASLNVYPVGPGLSDNSITSIIEDHAGILWIGTYKGGLNRFDPSSQSFYHWFRDPEKRYQQYPGYVTSLFEDRFHTIWIGCYEGLFQGKQQGDSLCFRQWTNDPDQHFSLSDSHVWSLYESPSDSSRGFWICTFMGLHFFNINSEKFTRYLPDQVEGDPFARSISSITEDQFNGKRIFWLGSYGGLLRFDPSNGSYQRWRYNENDPLSLSNNRIIDVYLDRSNVLWLATNSGLNYFSRKWGNFSIRTLDPNSADKQDHNLKEMTAFCTTSDGTIWIGTNHGLYYIMSRSTGKYVQKYQKFSAADIWSICSGNPGYLWIGTYGNGLFRLEISSGKFEHWLQNDQTGKGPANNYIRAVVQDRQGMIWIGLWGRGLNRFNPRTGEWHLYLHDRNDPHSLSYNDVWDILEDQYGNLWIGTKGGGLNLYDRERDRFYCWQAPRYLSHNGILTITQSYIPSSTSSDSSTGLWIGTENGLNYINFDPNTSQTDFIPNVRTVSFSAKNGLPSNIIKSIIEDGQGNLWIGTNLGLAKILKNFPLPAVNSREATRYPEKLPIHLYTVKDGLPDNDFTTQAVCQSTEGTFFWGSIGGLISISPSQITENSYIPPVVISKIEVQNEIIPRKYYANVTDQNNPNPLLDLKHDQNAISFWYSALDFNAAEDCQFKYKLEGFEPEWIEAGHRKFVSYTNLDPGEYTFRLKGSNSDGIWNETVASFSFTISPPWWRTRWAYLGYISLIITMLFTLRRFEMNRVQLRHQLTLQTLETRKFQELEKMKSRFFTNLSHEFRTPLMLISGPIEQLRSGSYKGNLKKMYEVISRNSRRLRDLIDQSLALSQLEAGALPLRTREENLIPLVQGLVHSFDSLAEKKGIQIKFESSSDFCPAWIDHDKFEKIINNLLSNSLKFTPAGGRITVTIKMTESAVSTIPQTISISVSDTGIGMSPDHQKRVFNRFYQVDNSSYRLYEGTGIGLALVKELVELQHWAISVESELGKGSTFTLLIPKGRSHLKDEEVVSETLPSSEQKLVDLIESENPQAELKRLPEQKISAKLKKTSQTSGTLIHVSNILIVEDSPDVRYYLSTILADDYHLHEAASGEEGLKKAASGSPDLIISDIIMPAMDGIEFCRRIKSDINTSHIPVILLTARASLESRLEGLETGADDYLIKPFERRELLVRVKNLIGLRRRLQDKFKRELLVEPSAVTVTSLDEDFLKRAIQAVEKNLGDPEFETENFARSLYVSRSQLHRKLTGLTGQTPGEFIRTMRLKQAAQLLQKRGTNVSEVAYDVGFNNLSYFAKAFRRQFNCSPSEYQEKSE